MRRVLMMSLLGLTVAGAAWAQQPPGGGGRPEGWRGGMACAVQDGRVKDMLDRAHWRLRITPAEDAAWTKMTNDVTAAVQPLAQDCGRRPDAAAALPDRLKQMAQDGQLRLQAVTGVQAAVAGMYAELSPEQKLAADRMMRPHGPRGMRPPGPPPGGEAPPPPRP